MNGNLNNTKVCPNCGITNLANAKFCIKCGANLEVNNNMNSELQNNNFDNGTYNNMNNTNNVNAYNNNQVSSGKLDYVKYLLGSLLKPYDTYKNNESTLGDIKNASILTLIVVGIMTAINLLSTMISAVRHKSFFSGEVTWNWDNLGDVEYFKVIGLDLLVYAGIIAAIAGVYYLGSLVIKKNAKFSNLIGAATTSVVPFATCSLLLSPILSMIYSPLGIATTVVGFVYTLVTLIELVNDIVVIDNKNTRIYYHLVCLSTVIIVGGFIAYKVLVNSIFGGLDSLF